MPADISVAACDDVFASEVHSPPLSARVGPMAEIGRAAVNLVVAIGEDPDGDEDRSLEFPAQFVVRGSTGPAPMR